MESFSQIVFEIIHPINNFDGSCFRKFFGNYFSQSHQILHGSYYKRGCVFPIVIWFEFRKAIVSTIILTTRPSLWMTVLFKSSATRSDFSLLFWWSFPSVKIKTLKIFCWLDSSIIQNLINYNIDDKQIILIHWTAISKSIVIPTTKFNIYFIFGVRIRRKILSFGSSKETDR